MNFFSGLEHLFFKPKYKTKPVICVLQISDLTSLFSFFFHHLSRFTYEIAPVFVLMEQITLKKMREIVGWSSKDGDGIFSPGRFLFSFPDSPQGLQYGSLGSLRTLNTK